MCISSDESLVEMAMFLTGMELQCNCRTTNEDEAEERRAGMERSKGKRDIRVGALPACD